MPEEENLEHKEEEQPKVLDDPDEKEASDLITAAHNSSKELGLGVWKRVLELLIKIIGVKGLFFGICTYFYFYGGEKVPMWLWAFSGLILVGGSYVDLFMAKIKK